MSADPDELKPDTNPEEDAPKRGRPKGSTDSKPRRRRRAKVSVREAVEGTVHMGTSLAALGGARPCCIGVVDAEAAAIGIAFEEIAKEYPAFQRAAETGSFLKWLALGLPLFRIGSHVSGHIRDAREGVSHITEEEAATLPFVCTECGFEMRPPHEELPTDVCPECGRSTFMPTYPPVAATS